MTGPDWLLLACLLAAAAVGYVAGRAGEAGERAESFRTGWCAGYQTRERECAARRQNQRG